MNKRGFANFNNKISRDVNLHASADFVKQVLLGWLGLGSFLLLFILKKDGIWLILIIKKPPYFAGRFCGVILFNFIYFSF
ncbi:MAG: hypothetical protein ACLTMR_09295 [Faecalibacillus sp.]